MRRYIGTYMITINILYHYSLIYILVYIKYNHKDKLNILLYLIIAYRYNNVSYITTYLYNRIQIYLDIGR